MSSRESPDWAKTLDDLRSLSDEELVRQQDEHITGEYRPGVAVRVDYYLEDSTGERFRARVSEWSG